MKTLFLCWITSVSVIYRSTGRRFDHSTEQTTLVNVTSGMLQGTQLYCTGKNAPALTFFNIPYAQPPVGDLRFQPPQASISWEGIRDATEHGLPCPQNLRYLREHFPNSPMPIPTKTSEDCLHLNVYTPSLSGGRAVVVYIHGGSWISGWAGSADGRTYAVHEDIVVVTIQYRLGALGFLPIGNKVNANLGLLDQVAALKWVQTNIRAFGGNPRRITLFGHGTGATSAGIHVTSPLSEGLFHRVIYQSGAALWPYAVALPQEGFQNAVSYSLASGCGDLRQLGENPIMSCLHNKTSKELVEILGRSGVLVKAVKDMSMIPKHPRDAVQQMFTSGNQQRLDIPVMAGVCQSEAYAVSKKVIPDLLNNPFPKVKLLHHVQELVKNYYNLPSTESGSDIAQEVVKYYAAHTEDHDELREIMVDIIGDMYIAVPTFTQAAAHSSAGSLAYFYEFGHRPSWSAKPHYITADYGDDMLFTWGLSRNPDVHKKHVTFTKEEESFDKMMLKYWTNFIKTGDPNESGLPWWTAIGSDMKYIKLMPKPALDISYRHSQIQFWIQLIPQTSTKRYDEL